MSLGVTKHRAGKKKDRMTSGSEGRLSKEKKQKEKIFELLVSQKIASEQRGKE